MNPRSDQIQLKYDLDLWPDGSAKVCVCPEHNLITIIINCFGSGATKVGVTRGGNWGCHPIFFLQKTDDPFLLITTTFYHFLLISLGCHLTPWRVSHRTFFTCPTSFVHYSV